MQMELSLVNATAVDVNFHIPALTARRQLSEVCTSPEYAETIIAFRGRTLSLAQQGKKKKAIAHCKRCLPCSIKLGWGIL